MKCVILCIDVRLVSALLPVSIFCPTFTEVTAVQLRHAVEYEMGIVISSRRAQPCSYGVVFSLIDRYFGHTHLRPTLSSYRASMEHYYRMSCYARAGIMVSHTIMHCTQCAARAILLHAVILDMQE